MGEKRKWFDRQEEILPEIKPITGIAIVDTDSLKKFAESIKRLQKNHRIVFLNKCILSPSERLSRGIATTAMLLSEGSLASRNPPGLSDSEYNALVALEKSMPTKEQKEIAQALLCVYERYNYTRLMEVAHRKTRQASKEGGALDRRVISTYYK